MANGHKFCSEWQQRNTIAVVGFFGMAIMYSIRYNISIGIVAMVDHERVGLKNPLNLNGSSHSQKLEICPAPNLSNNISETSSVEASSSQGRNDDFTKFIWSEAEQGLILGSFFWGYMITQFPGGILAQKFGGKWIISFGILGAGLLSLALPVCATMGGLKIVVFIRFLQGISEGVIIPAFAVMLSKWTIPSERASIATLCFSGMPFGTATTMIVSGHLISSFGWPAVFYVPGVLSILWFTIWSFLVYSSPQEHPKISAKELEYLQKSNNSDFNENAHTETHNIRDIPWKEIIKSGPVWAILGSHFANTWGHNTLKSEGPKYLHSVLHFDIHANAYIAATPYLCQWIFCNAVARFSDYLISKGWISISASRKLCNTIGQGGTALAYGVLLLADCNRSLAITAFVLSGLFNGAAYGGFLVNPVDISPNYAGVIEGLINGISNFAGFAAPFVAGIILHNEPSIHGWRYIFLIPAIGDFVGNLIFVLFSSVKVQAWDKLKVKNNKGTL